jgi:hypothetical protein
MNYIAMLAILLMSLTAGCTSVPKTPTTVDTLSGLSTRGAIYTSQWPTLGTFSWAGPEFWPDRVDGWHTVNGKLICQGNDERPMRHITLASPTLGPSGASFSAEIEIGEISRNKSNYAGFLLGLPSALPYPAATTSTLSRVIFAGITGSGHAVLAANPSDDRLNCFYKSQTNSVALPPAVRLTLRGVSFQNRYTLVLSCTDAQSNREIARASLWDVPPALLEGHIALVTGPTRNQKEGPFWFRNLRLNGEKVVVDEKTTRATPIVGAWYTYRGKALNMHVQTRPVSPEQRNTISLAYQTEDRWKTMATAAVNPDGSADLTVPNWPCNRPVHYRLEMPLTYSDTCDAATYTGVIRPDPTAASLVTLALADTPPIPDGAPAVPSASAEATAATTPHALVFSSGIKACDNPDARLAWALAYAELGRIIPCIGVTDQHATCGGLSVVQCDSASPAPSPDEEWLLWAGAEALLSLSPDIFTSVAAANMVTNEPTGLFSSPHICPTLHATNGFPFIRYDRHRQTIEYHRVELHRNGHKVQGDLPGWPVVVPLRNPGYERPYGYLVPIQVAGLQDPLMQIIDQDTNTSVYLERVRSHMALPRVYEEGTYTVRIGSPERGLHKELTDLAPASLGDTETARITF